MALGMLLTSLAFLILFVAAKSGGDQTFVTDAQGQFVLDEHGEFKAIQNRVSPIWLIAAYMVISLGELMLSPMGLSLVSKVAPSRMRGLMMGGWFVATAIGNKLTVIGMLWTKWYHSSFWLLCSLLALGMAFVLLAAAAAAQEGDAGRLTRLHGFHPEKVGLRTMLRLRFSFPMALVVLRSPHGLCAPAARPMTIDDLLAVKGVADPQLSPDGSMVVYVVSELDRAHRQDEQQPLAGPGLRRRAQATDDHAGDQQPSPLEPRRQDDRVRLEPRRLVAGLAPADRRRRAPPVDQAADRRLRPALVAQGGQDRLHRRGLSRSDSRADRRQGQGEGSLQEQGPHL